MKLAHEHTRLGALSHPFGFGGERRCASGRGGGRSLTKLAAAKKSELSPFPTVRGPVFHDALTASYGTGLDAIAVTTRRGKPLDAVPQMTAHTTTLTSGVLRGEKVYVSDAPTAPGYLSGFHDGLVIEISAPTARDALAAANSLARS